ncbi:hypothetical protein BH10PSE7_BH10PSE7_15620 [soil metagenome]
MLLDRAILARMALLFDEPVVVFEAPRSRRELRDVESASRWLVEKWPKPKHRKHFKIAAGTCLAALEGRVTAAEARAAFAAAAEIEGLLLTY